MMVGSGVMQTLADNSVWVVRWRIMLGGGRESMGFHGLDGLVVVLCRRGLNV